MPEGRYSRNASRSPADAPTPKSRRRAISLSVLGALAGLVVAFVGYRNLADKPVTAEVITFDVVNSSTVEMRFTVTRSDPAKAAVCIVRARSIDGSETGRREVYVPPSPESVLSLSTSVRTSAPPVVGDVYGCGSTVPAYLVPAR
ncbi:MAG: DUF4307 domain-containing protein [Mycobacteriaceae bacterium]